MRTLSLALVAALCTAGMCPGQEEKPATPKPAERGETKRQDPKKLTVQELITFTQAVNGLQLAGRVLNAEGQPVNGAIGRLAFAQHGVLLATLAANPNSPVAKAPAALEALKEIEKATAQVRSAKDVDSTLKALEDIEKALMKMRSELWKLKEKAKQKQGKDER